MRPYEQLFSANLHRLRSEAGLTQRELAERLGYSEKSVSKWERADGIPGIAALYDLAELFGVPLDELFTDGRVRLLGIDGGGTKTKLVLADSELNPIRELRADCCNPIDIGLDAAKTLLRGAVESILGDLPRSSVRMFAGIAGGTSSDIKPELERFFGSFGFGAYACGSDNDSILAAGLEGRDGVTVIMGTGICVFSQSGGVRRRVGGWGYLFDGGGSAYDLGREAVAAHFASLDGSGERTQLSELLERSHPNPQELLGELYRGGKKSIAALAPLVFEAAESGDSTAEAILERNLAHAARLIKTAASHVETKPVRVVLAGGLTERDSTISGLTRLLEREEIELTRLTCEPVRGALMLARELSP